MNAVVLVMFLALCAVPAHSFAQALTAAEIDDAILAGQSGKEKQLVYTCTAVIPFREIFRLEKVGSSIMANNAFDITLSMTTGRIARLSAAAKRLYKPYTAAEVPVDLKMLAAILDAEPQEPEQSTSNGTIWYSVSSPIQQIVMKTPKGDLVVRPNDFKTEKIEWSVGGKRVPSNRAHARFPVGQIRELPPGEISIVAVTEAGERRCSMSTGDRRRIFGR
jgi:hypothetical protein